MKGDSAAVEHTGDLLKEKTNDGTFTRALQQVPQFKFVYQTLLLTEPQYNEQASDSDSDSAEKRATAIGVTVTLTGIVLIVIVVLLVRTEMAKVTWRRLRGAGPSSSSQSAYYLQV